VKEKAGFGNASSLRRAAETSTRGRGLPEQI